MPAAAANTRWSAESAPSSPARIHRCRRARRRGCGASGRARRAGPGCAALSSTVKTPSLAEHVREDGEASARDLGDHLVATRARVALAVGAVLDRHLVRAHERRRQRDRMAGGRRADRLAASAARTPWRARSRSSPRRSSCPERASRRGAARRAASTRRWRRASPRRCARCRRPRRRSRDRWRRPGAADLVVAVAGERRCVWASTKPGTTGVRGRPGPGRRRRGATVRGHSAAGPTATMRPSAGAIDASRTAPVGLAPRLTRAPGPRTSPPGRRSSIRRSAAIMRSTGTLARKVGRARHLRSASACGGRRVAGDDVRRPAAARRAPRPK